MSARTLLSLPLLFLAALPLPAETPPPILDMHLHVRKADYMGAYRSTATSRGSSKRVTPTA